MSPLKIDVVAPPFHGHLHPILGLAQILREFGNVRVLTTPDAAARVARAGFETYSILNDHVENVWGIASTTGPVRGRPWMLWRQFRENLRLIPFLQREVEAAWQSRRPDLVLVDFTLPSVGHQARAKGIRWWTSHPSPLAIETPDSTPAYLGGWLPPVSWIGRARDALGRKAIRGFKQTIFSLYRRELRQMGLTTGYRPDHSEAVYSNEVILALGSAELEYPRSWPRTVRFVGPVYYTPDIEDSSVLHLDLRRKNILVTIGTHLPYARRRLSRSLQAWAREMPDIFFHYTTGGNAESTEFEGENWRRYRYLNYDRVIDQFDGIVHHGGAGITYHCLKAGIPAVVWPQDYDQFDFAARLEQRGLGIVCRKAAEIPDALRQMLRHKTLWSQTELFAQHLRTFDQRERIKCVLEEQGIFADQPTASVRVPVSE